MNNLFKTYITKKHIHASSLTGALLVSFFIAFLFNAYLGRVLTFADFGVITFISSLWLIIGVFCNALSLTINKMVIHTEKKEGISKAYALFMHIKKNSATIALICFAVAAIFSYWISKAFSLQSPIVVVTIATLFITGILAAANRGYLQSKFSFASVGIVLVAESAIKLLLAVAFIQLIPWKYVYLSIPLSALAAFVLSEYLLPKDEQKTHTEKVVFPMHFYLASVLTVLSTMLLLTSDVILAKLFLSPQSAGEYSFLSLIGKMIYFFGSLLNTLMVPYISERIAQGADDARLFYQFLIGNGLFISAIFLVVGVFGPVTVPLLLGSKVQQISQYLLVYSTAIALITISNIFVVYHLLHHRYIFPSISLLISILIILTMIFFHNNISVIVNILFTYSFLLITSVLYLHMNSGARSFLEVKMQFLKNAYEK